MREDDLTKGMRVRYRGESGWFVSMLPGADHHLVIRHAATGAPKIVHADDVEPDTSEPTATSSVVPKGRTLH